VRVFLSPVIVIRDRGKTTGMRLSIRNGVESIDSLSVRLEGKVVARA
jgi:hypothetical protein